MTTIVSNINLGNKSFENDIYIMASSRHEPKEDLTELRTDEALLYIQGLASALNRKMTGLEAKEKRGLFETS